MVVRRAHARLAEDGLSLPSADVYARTLYRRLVRAYLGSKVTRREAPLRPVLAGVHRRLGIPMDGETMDRLMSAVADAIDPYVTTEPGAAQMARELTEAGYRLGIVSNTMFDAPQLDDDLAKHGLLPYFPVRVYSSETGHMKPSRAIFRIALERIGAPGEKTMFVGDRMDNDIRGAARMGMTTVLLAPTGRVPRGWTQPDYVISKLLELVPIVGAVNR